MSAISFVRNAAPMIGGMISLAVQTLLVIPVIYALVKQREQVNMKSLKERMTHFIHHTRQGV